VCGRPEILVAARAYAMDKFRAYRWHHDRDDYARTRP
jgi:hypothetical protein